MADEYVCRTPLSLDTDFPDNMIYGWIAMANTTGRQKKKKSLADLDGC
jgi:hypothetical protein